MSPVPDDPIPPTVAWHDGTVRLIDQRRLPGALVFADCHTVDEVVAAIAGPHRQGCPGARRDRCVRGRARGGRRGASEADVRRGVGPAALGPPDRGEPRVGRRRGARRVAPRRRGRRRSARADAIAAADVATNRALGAHGAALLPPVAAVLTHCNAGALACVGYGTALGVVRAAHEGGRTVTVWVDETRPVLQGARLTAWELDRLGIPYRVVVDAAAGSLFAAGAVDAVVVGADRVAANGDVANKIGTYSLAVLADAHGVPFYVAAPTTTVDLATATRCRHPDRAADRCRGRRRRRQRASCRRAPRCTTRRST